MTNSEKFCEVFGFTPDERVCVAPPNVCLGNECEICPFDDWWNKEYKPCFKMKEEFEQKSFDVYSDGTKEQIEEYEKMELDGYEQYLASGCTDEGDPHSDDYVNDRQKALLDMLKKYGRY